jgi:hypothetical protein
MEIRRAQTILFYAAFFLVTFGIKLYFILNYGNPTPYWDQWDWEALYLYKPFLEGTLHLSDLIVPLNEHRVLLTRLLDLLEIEINVLWNPVLQMVVNSLLHLCAIVLIVHFLNKMFRKPAVPALLLFSLILFGVPYAWENTLVGIQSMFYFVLLFSTLTLWLLINHTPFSKLWWLGVASSILAFFSLASGVLALAAVGFVRIVKLFMTKRASRKFIFELVIVGGLFLLGVALTPTLSYHQPLRASSFGQFLQALLGTLSWPEYSGYLASLIRNLPSIIFVCAFLKSRPTSDDKRWFLFGLIAWMTVTSFALAFARATGSTAPRYLDLFAMFVLVNFACVIALVQGSSHFGTKRFRKPVIAGIAWILAVLVSLSLRGIDPVKKAITDKKETSAIQETNVKNYLETGDKDQLRNKEFLHIPYPDPERLLMILSSPTVRSVLPGNLQVDPSNPRTGRLDELIRRLTSNYALFILCGITVGLISFVGLRPRSKSPVKQKC